jgi:hypothetical protein
MKKWCYPAAAVAGGLLLIGGAPAYADGGLPVPAGQQGAQPLGGLGDLLDPAGNVLDPSGGVRVDGPLAGTPVVKVKPGANTPDLAGLAPRAHTGLGGVPPKGATSQQPAADVVGEALPQAGGLPVGGLPVGELPVGELPSLGGLPLVGGLSGGLPLVGGLLPDGRAPLAARQARTESLLGGGLPVLGDLGGLLPDSAPTTLPAGATDVSGMPPGGAAIPTDPSAGDPSAADPSAAGPAAADPSAADAASQDARAVHDARNDAAAGAGSGRNHRAFSTTDRPTVDGPATP